MLTLYRGIQMCHVNLADYVQNRLFSPAVPEPEKAAWRELLSLLGGEQVLVLPHQLLDQRWAKDYKTAFSFFKDFCSAVGTADEVTALRLLAEQAEVMAYLEQGVKRNIFAYPISWRLFISRYRSFVNMLAWWPNGDPLLASRSRSPMHLPFSRNT